MADPGFPVGGALTHWGGANLRHVHFLVKTYAKMKEMDPVGGHVPAAPPWIRQWYGIIKTQTRLYRMTHLFRMVGNFGNVVSRDKLSQLYRAHYKINLRRYRSFIVNYKYTNKLF